MTGVRNMQVVSRLSVAPAGIWSLSSLKRLVRVTRHVAYCPMILYIWPCVHDTTVLLYCCCSVDRTLAVTVTLLPRRLSFALVLN